MDLPDQRLARSIAPIRDLLPRTDTTRPLNRHLIERRHTTNPAPYTEHQTLPRRTAIGTLVERWSRYVMLFSLPDGHTAEAVRTALANTVHRLPEHLWQSLTWDQGKEMAQHAQFTVDTGVQVHFCDPNSRWQRGSNENTNGLLRQNFPKGTDMAALTQTDLDAAAHYSLIGRPRQTLGWMTASDKLAEAVQQPLEATQDMGGATAFW